MPSDGRPPFVVRRPPSPALRLLSASSAWNAAAWYLAATLVLTWPLARGLASDFPADTGDSLLNCWILAWGAEHVLRFLGGDLHAFDGFWNGNFFHPARLTLAYSEHLVPQALQIAPVYALTGNIILCYNLVFLSTFVLAGLGTYLLVRELTGDGRAALVAGLFFAFTPYRVAQFTHVQVLSVQWMPFVLYGLARYARSGRVRPLSGASLALLAQNLSCGYFLLYFGPFAAAYGVWEVVRLRGKAWPAALGRLMLAFGLVGALTIPFALPYMDLRALGFPPRPIEEVESYSADVLSYLTGPPTSNGTASLFQVFLKPEGEVFLGLVPMALAAAAILLAWRDARRGWRAASPGHAGLAGETAYGIGRLRAGPRLGRAVSAVLVFIVALEAGAALFILATGPHVLRVGGMAIGVRELGRLVRIGGLAALLLLAWSGRARGTLRRMAPIAFWVAAATMAAALSLGPVVKTGGEPLGNGPYRVLYQHAPGFDGVRVPSRLALEVALFVAVLSGFALARLGSRPGKRLVPGSPVAAGLVSLLFLAEVWPPPIRVNHADPVERAVTPPTPVPYGQDTPPVYAYLAGLPRDTVILEMPLGPEGYELRYIFYSTQHWRPLVNGYSGGLPDQYYRVALDLGHPVRDWDRAWNALAASTAEVVVVHEGAYLEGQGPRIGQWLEHHGARRIAAFGRDVVFALPGPHEAGGAPSSAGGAGLPRRSSPSPSGGG